MFSRPRAMPSGHFPAAILAMAMRQNRTPMGMPLMPPTATEAWLSKSPAPKKRGTFKQKARAEAARRRRRVSRH